MAALCVRVCTCFSTIVLIRASHLYIKAYAISCATLAGHPAPYCRRRVPARGQATMQERKQIATPLVTLPDTSAVAAASRRGGGWPDGTRPAPSPSGSDTMTSASAGLSTRPDRPCAIRQERLRSTEPEPRRSAASGPRRSTEPEPRRSAAPGARRHTRRRQQTRSTRCQRPRNQRSQPARDYRSELVRPSGTGKLRLSSRTEPEPLNARIRFEICSPRRGKPADRNCWLPRSICREPAYSMLNIELLARVSCLPLRTPTAARLSPARGRAGDGAPAPSFRCADG